MKAAAIEQAPAGDMAATLKHMLAEADAAGLAPGEAPAPELDPEQQKAAAIAERAAEIAGYLDALVEAAKAADIPKLEELLPADRRAKIARAAGAVAVKRGWSTGDLFARWKEEIELVEALAPILIFAGTVLWQRIQPAKPALPKPAAPQVPAAAAPASARKPLVEVNGQPV